MELYLVIVEDRHVDVAVYPFSDKEKAIETGKALAQEYCRHQEDYEEHDSAKHGWLFHATYSCEGDSVRVHPATMDEEP